MADFVVVANRLPVDMETLPDGTTEWKASPGGLVTALAPMLRGRGGAWVGWPGMRRRGARAVRGRRPRSCTRSRCPPQDVEDYYEGFSNATLWPLYHDVVAPPEFHRHWWQAYVKVNERFADAVAEVAAEGATVWVQDYQLQLVPAALRERRPDLRIGFFLHIPFPPTELFMQLPWRKRIIEGLLGADLVGFHTPGGARNFRAARHPARRRDRGRAQRAALRRPHRQARRVPDLHRRRGARRARPHPRGPATAPRRSAPTSATRAGDPRRRPARLHQGHRRPPARLRGAAERTARADDTVMIQIATPSRERVEHYQRLRAEVEQAVGRINGEYARVGRTRCCTTCTSRCPARSSPRSSPPPTSCSSRRCGTA